ncbi:unnamed protein product, partial [Dovyalis caffra]
TQHVYPAEHNRSHWNVPLLPTSLQKLPLDPHFSTPPYPAINTTVPSVNITEKT